MKIAWAEGKRAAMVLGDGAYKFLNILPDVAIQDFGIYVGDSGKDDAMRQVVQQLAQSALQAGNIDMLNVIKVLKADTMTEAEKVLEQAMTEAQKQQQQAMQEQMQAQQAAAEQKQVEFESEAQLKQIDNEAKLQVAQIGADSRIKVANIQSETDRDIHDAKEQSEMNKKLVDHNIRESEKESDRENRKKDDENTPSLTTKRSDLERAKTKI